MPVLLQVWRWGLRRRLARLSGNGFNLLGLRKWTASLGCSCSLDQCLSWLVKKAWGGGNRISGFLWRIFPWVRGSYSKRGLGLSPLQEAIAGLQNTGQLSPSITSMFWWKWLRSWLHNNFQIPCWSGLPGFLSVRIQIWVWVKNDIGCTFVWSLSRAGLSMGSTIILVSPRSIPVGDDWGREIPPTAPIIVYWVPHG